jgi:hypothetical protein
MPLTIPNLSDRKYQDLLDEALARIQVHTPEWKNFNDSDPGVTLIQLFAFLTENLLYRANQMPERNRRKFLKLLGIPLLPSTPAQGLVTIRNERGPLKTITLNSNVEVRAGETPFRTRAALDVLPVDWQVVVKQPENVAPEDIVNVYKKLYASYKQQGVAQDFSIYRAVPLTSAGSLSAQGSVKPIETIDNAIWIALLVRKADRDQPIDEVRKKIGGKTVNLGLVPAISAKSQYRVLSPGKAVARSEEALNLLRFDIPGGGSLQGESREPGYRKLEASTTDNILAEPGVIQIVLPEWDKLKMWDDIDPLEPGVGNLPPALDDTDLNSRLITWIRVSLASTTVASGPVSLSLLWAGINTSWIDQKTHVTGEGLAQGTGQPDQVAKLSRAPVISGSVQVTVLSKGKAEPPWSYLDDLLAAGPEVPVPGPRLPPGAPPRKKRPSTVFTVNPESGEVIFGDGLRGARPPYGARLLADYDYCVGRAGNVGANSIDGGPSLPAGFKAVNEVPTWGGNNAESVNDGEKQIPRYLQHRDRLVTVDDFKTLAARTPGVELGRVEVLPAFRPGLGTNEKGDAPGAVTLILIPKYDLSQPDFPQPDRLFLDAVCRYLNPKRLITTEIYLVGPEYVNLWISVGIRVEPGASVAAVREEVKAQLRSFLSPLPQGEAEKTSGQASLFFGQANGWPLNTDVLRQQLIAVADRVRGVLMVNDLLLAQEEKDTLKQDDSVRLQGLQLPRIQGISVVPGDPLSMNELRKQTLGLAIPESAGGRATEKEKQGLPLPVPAIPEECQ